MILFAVLLGVVKKRNTNVNFSAGFGNAIELVDDGVEILHVFEDMRGEDAIEVIIRERPGNSPRSVIWLPP